MVGVLNAYRFETPAPEYQLAYAPMCLNFLKHVDSNQTFKNYAFALGEEPKSIDECDAWIITGSPKSAYDNDPWILRLGNFIRQCHAQRKKLIGICFGHQLIAHTLGGLAEKSKNGWGVGVHTYHILKAKPWMTPQLLEVSLLFSHQDQVVRLPAGAELLAADEFCPFQMYSMESHILCLQGHPEFTVEFAKARLDTRVTSVGQEKYERAIQSLAMKTNASEVGQWMKNFILL